MDSRAARRLQPVKVPLQRVLRRLGYQLTPLEVESAAHRTNLIERFGISTVIDVGANVGQTGAAFRDLGFTGTIHSFEPMASAYAHLIRSARGDDSWFTHNVALSDSVGRSVLHVSENSVSSSILEVDTLHAEAAPASRQVREEEIQVSTLDTEFPRPEGRYWLKIDTQGLEVAVLKGGENFTPYCDVVQVEVSVRALYRGQSSQVELFGLIERMGLVVADVIPGFRDPRNGDLLQFDLLAIRASGES
jgi:FkbM family methyltransferase